MRPISCRTPGLRGGKPLVAALAVAAMATLGGCDRQSAAPAQPGQSASGGTAQPGGTVDRSHVDRSHKGSRIPDLTVKDPAGRELRLIALPGHPVLVNLWATWCAPCIAELPQLDKIAAGPGGPRVITISEDLSAPEKVAAFLKDRKLAHLEPWLDPDNEASSQYQVQSLPTSILYDAGGREVWRLTGGHDWTTPETDKLLAEAR